MSIKLTNFFQNMSLLYAEDEVVSRTLYESYFKQYFNPVYIADNGQQALDLYKQNNPDIIILDINMPLISGLDVCKMIRQNDKQTKIILLTARSDKQAFLEAIELGLTSYLEKPVTEEQINSALQKLAHDVNTSSKIPLWKVNEQNYFWCITKRELFCQENIISLTKKEKSLLELFITTRHEKINYQQIHNVLWADDHHNQLYSETSIKSIIKKLRAKLPPHVIKNTYGLGYSLEKL